VACLPVMDDPIETSLALYKLPAAPEPYPAPPLEIPTVVTLLRP